MDHVDLKGKGCWLLMLVLFGLLAGCSQKADHGNSFLRENVDLGYVRKIAVLPMANNSNDEFAPERLRDITITQVLATGLFDVVDKGMVDGLLRQEAIDPAKPLTRQAMKLLAQRLGVQALLLGTVDFASETRRGSVVYPELSATLRLLEVEQGLIIWQASGHGSGDSLGRRLFGQASVDTFQTTVRLVNELLATLPREQR